MSSAQGLQKATAPYRNPLATIKRKPCALCKQQGIDRPATCAVIGLIVRGACNEHALAAKEFGYDVIFPEGVEMNEQVEIIIEPSARGYRFELPEWCAPNPKTTLNGLKALIKGYDLDKKVRKFPESDLQKVIDFLNYWYVEPNPSMPTRNRNGGKIVAVRVVTPEEVQAMEDEAMRDVYTDSSAPGRYDGLD